MIRQPTAGRRQPVAVLNQAQALIQKRTLKERQGVSVWVTAREAFWVAMEALRSHKLRSFLTLLGVVIATTTLIVVMSIVNGMNVYIAEHIANLGTNTFVLHQFKWAQGFDSFLKAPRRGHWSGSGGDAFSFRRSARQGSRAGRYSFPRRRRDGTGRKHLRSEPGQLRPCSLDYLSYHLDGTAGAVCVRQGAGRPSHVGARGRSQGLDARAPPRSLQRGRHLRHQCLRHFDERLAKPDGYDFRRDHW